MKLMHTQRTALPLRNDDRPARVRDLVMAARIVGDITGPEADTLHKLATALMEADALEVTIEVWS